MTVVLGLTEFIRKNYAHNTVCVVPFSFYFAGYQYYPHIAVLLFAGMHG